MKTEIKEVYAEIHELFKYISEEQVEKIPKKFRDFIEQEKEDNYSVNIDIDKPLDEQNLKRKTFTMLAILNYNYWCDNNEEKKKLLYLYTENEKNKELELKQKYNSSNIFNKKRLINKDSNTYQNNTEEKSVVEYKKPIYKKIIEKILRLFKK